jgi:hypothetical protein
MKHFSPIMCHSYLLTVGKVSAGGGEKRRDELKVGMTATASGDSSSLVQLLASSQHGGSSADGGAGLEMRDGHRRRRHDDSFSLLSCHRFESFAAGWVLRWYRKIRGKEMEMGTLWQ